MAPGRSSLLLLLSAAVIAVGLPAPGVLAQSPPAADPSWEGGVVEGRLIDSASGEAISGEFVRLVRITREGAGRYPYPWVPEIESSQVRTRTEVTDADGRFRFEGLRAGRFRVRVGLPLVDPVTVLGVSAADPHHELALDVALGRHLTGGVVGPGGGPVAGALVFLTGREDADGLNARWDQEPQGREAGDDGSFLLAGLPEGTLWIEAFHPDHGFSPALRITEEDPPNALTLILREELQALVSPDRRTYGGVGISVGASPRGPVVVGVTEGLAAHRAGIVTGDVIAAIGGVETRFMVVDEFVMRCRGPVGKPVWLRVERGGERLDLELIRQALE